MMLTNYYLVFQRGIAITLSILFLSGCVQPILQLEPDLIVPGSDMKFVYVKGGSFEMGSSNPDQHNESPVHTVMVDDMFVGMYEVTFKQFDRFCAATGRERPDDMGWGRGNRPAIHLSRHDAVAFTEWLSAESGEQVSLPSEAQWEYFARAGTVSSFWIGDKPPAGWANCATCGSDWDNQKTAPVGSFMPNSLGLYDTSGNVAEWTLDDYKNSYNNAPADGSPLSLENGTFKVLRGGSWNSIMSDLRSSARDYRRISLGPSSNIGFRVILKPSIETPLPLPQK